MYSKFIRKAWEGEAGNRSDRSGCHVENRLESKEFSGNNWKSSQKTEDEALAKGVDMKTERTVGFTQC